MIRCLMELPNLKNKTLQTVRIRVCMEMNKNNDNNDDNRKLQIWQDLMNVVIRTDVRNLLNSVRFCRFVFLKKQRQGKRIILFRLRIVVWC